MSSDLTAECHVIVAGSARIDAQLLGDALKRNGRFVVAECVASTSELVASAQRYHPHLFAISSAFDGDPAAGFHAARFVRTSFPQTKIVLLLESSRREQVIEAFRSGARGVFCRSDSFQNLIKCIRSVYAGQIWADSTQLGYLLEALAAQPAPLFDARAVELLTKQEQVAARYVAEGLSNREIAARMHVSEHTVKNYLFHIFEKLGVSSRVELALYLFAGNAQNFSARSMNSRIDDAALFENYRGAAEKGSPVAQFKLAQMYRDGCGVNQDHLAAYMWFLLAERTASAICRNNRFARKRLAANLNEDQIDGAGRRASEWLKSNKRVELPTLLTAESTLLRAPVRKFLHTG